jgi:predicted HTH transcriptional regulator
MNLTASELRAILDEGEGRTLELKRGLPRDAKTARSLCAFANTRGGMLAIGVTDRLEIYGVPRPREVMARLRELCARAVDPPITAALQAVRIEGKTVVCCSVAASPRRPHATAPTDGEGGVGEESEIVVRVGASNRVAQGATLAALKRPLKARSGLDELERAILDFVDARARGPEPGGNATVQSFADTHNVGQQRARRAFNRLERDGALLGHGTGARRIYSRP